MKIWLDDVREPPDDTWTWCKNAAEFLSAIQYPPQIKTVSFDHDLGSDVHTGSTLCTEMILRCLEYGVWFPCSVHSANPCGRDNIESKLHSWLGVR